MSKPVDILIHCRDPQYVQRCGQSLLDQDLHVWTADCHVPDGVSLQIIVTDQPTLGDDLPQADIAARLVTGEIGVIRLAGESGADVCLSADFTARELALACRLLAQTVRLRQERNAAKRQAQRLRQLAYTDALTGLPNRRAWDEFLATHGETPQQQCTTRCLALLDLDHFKEVNDRWGHAVGDDVLRHVGRRLAALTPATDFAARLGGDEFALMITDREDSDPTLIVESLRTRVCEGSPHTAVTASAGSASGSKSTWVAWDALFHAASEALRQAKSSGRQQTCSRICSAVR